MERPKDTEEILSDDYEEGEILDGDNLYDEVSSLEEFSGGELESIPDKNGSENSSVEPHSDKKVKHAKHHRKKEHKCKENSVCRKERKGKHCYARIRKDKQSSFVKNKSFEETQPFIDKNVKREVISVVKRIAQRSRHDSPPIPLRQDSNKLHKPLHKDYHEKENRHSNKKHWAGNDKLPRNKTKHFEKHTHRCKTREHSKIRHSNSSVLGSCPNDAELIRIDDLEKNQTGSKTSLLKRLVGSGSAGVKTLKDTEISGAGTQPCNVENNKSTDSPITDCNTLSVSASVCTRVMNVTEDTGPLREKAQENPATSDSSVTEVPTKKVEVKWMRSIKEDKDELTLRVEALRSAWVKKLSERKKKGLIQKKAGEIDDSLVDFVLESETENSDLNSSLNDQLSVESSIIACTDVDNTSNSNTKFNVSDLSGDILKPEDMIIVSHDKSPDKPIICEPAFQLVASSDISNPSVSDSSVFIASSSTLFSTPQGTESNTMLQDTAVERDLQSVKTQNSSSHKQLNNYSFEKKKSKGSKCHHHSISQSKSTNDYKSYKNITPKSLRDRRSLSRSIGRSDRKSIAKSRKKNKRKGKRESLKNIINSFELDDEKALREQALLSLKSNTNRISSKHADGETVEIAKMSVTSTVSNQSTINNATVNQYSPRENLLKVKKLSSIGESEGMGATSSDNWEDDLDEDILRAQLLSSLTKQVSEQSTIIAQTMNVTSNPRPNFNIELTSNLRAQPPKKVIVRKNDKRKLKNINKKLWRQHTNLEKKIKLEDSKIRVKQFRKGNVFIKNDITVQVPLSVQSTNVPPIPQVPKLIISLNNDSDSSSDAEVNNEDCLKVSQGTPISNMLPSEIEANIDLLLLEAKKNTLLGNTDLDSGSALPPSTDNSKNVEQLDNCIKIQESTDDTSKISEVEAGASTANQAPEVTDHKPKTQQPLTNKSILKSTDNSATPQALRHLPTWQQEEYRRLKKKIAEKEKVLQCTRAKVTELKERANTSSPIASNESHGLPEQSVAKRDSSLPECDDIKPTNSSKSDDHLSVPCETDKTTISTDNVNANLIKNVEILPHLFSNDNNSTQKKNYAALASCSVMEEINVMNDIMNEFDKNSNEYSDLKTKWARLKKALKVTEAKMASKRKKLMQVRDKIQEKDRCISSKIGSISMAQVTPSEKTKAPSRDMELIKLKHKEMHLKAQLLLHNFSTEIKNWDDSKKDSPKVLQTSPIKRGSPKIPQVSVDRKRIATNGSQVLEKAKDVTEPPTKRSFSGKERERDEWDPNTPMCHFDLNGICKDEECKYQHFKTV